MLIDFLGQNYSWILCLHILAVISWMAGLLYLPRLFVYHCQASLEQEKARFIVMEHKLFSFIMTPAMFVALACGLLMLYLRPLLMLELWMHVKLTALILMIAFHFFAGQCQSLFAQGKNKRSERFYRMINEIPALLMVIIVVMVIIRPF